MSKHPPAARPAPVLLPRPTACETVLLHWGLWLVWCDYERPDIGQPRAAWHLAQIAAVLDACEVE